MGLKKKSFIFCLIFFFSICNSYSAMVTFNKIADVDDDPSTTSLASGIEFNSNGTKMFVSYANSSARVVLPAPGSPIINIIFIKLCIILTKH